MNVITLTLNPCVDRTLWVNEWDETPYKVEYQSGGKGINVARVLGQLGCPCMAFAPVGGDTGAHFVKLAQSEGVTLHTTPIAQAIRTVDTYVRTRDLAQRVTVSPLPTMDEAEVQAMYDAVDAQLPSAQLLAICGSACSSSAAQLIPRLIKRAQALGVQTLLDANGEALILGAAALPGLIKPNQDELEQLVNRAVPDGEEEEAAMTLIERGIPRVLVSLGERGSMLLTENLALYCPAPHVETVNPVGSGDSFVAAYIYAQLVGANEYLSLSYACAAGAANAQVFPAARVTKDEIEKLSGYSI